MTQADARMLARAPAPPEPADAERLAPLDHALMRRIIVGILPAMFLSALEQTTHRTLRRDGIETVRRSRETDIRRAVDSLGLPLLRQSKNVHSVAPAGHVGFRSHASSDCVDSAASRDGDILAASNRICHCVASRL
jgi:hypothetical protein